MHRSSNCERLLRQICTSNLSLTTPWRIHISSSTYEKRNISFTSKPLSTARHLNFRRHRWPRLWPRPIPVHSTTSLRRHRTTLLPATTSTHAAIFPRSTPVRRPSSDTSPLPAGTPSPPPGVSIAAARLKIKLFIRRREQKSTNSQSQEAANQSQKKQKAQHLYSATGRTPQLHRRCASQRKSAYNLRWSRSQCSWATEWVEFNNPPTQYRSFRKWKPCSRTSARSTTTVSKKHCISWYYIFYV